jgi:transposase
MSNEILCDGFIPRQYDIFAGLDVDKTSISVTFTNHQETIRSMRIPYSSDHLIHYVHRHFPGQKVAFAYEAGPTGYGLHDQLTAEGYPCLVVAASMIPTAPGQRVKTNRLDSQKISECLRGGQLKSIHVPSSSYRQLRHLTQLRDTFVRQATANKCRIKALLLLEGLPFPEAPVGSQWSKRVIAELKQLDCSGAVRFKLDRLLLSLEFSQKQAVETTREIRRFCRQDPEIHPCMEYLISIPGIGGIVASHLLARIGDWRQIRNVRQLSAFLGLVPTEHSTGEVVQRGAITRSGDGRLRNKLIQSAWSAIRQDPELTEFYRRVGQKHPRDRAAKKAIVAVARKLTTRIYAVLHEQRPYVMRPKSH